jgi:hypothetical protein
MMVSLSIGKKKCIFLGYADGVKGYRLWCSDPRLPKFIISRDVIFDESSLLHPSDKCQNIHILVLNLHLLIS